MSFDDYIELKNLPTCQKLDQKQLKIYDRPPLGKAEMLTRDI